MCAALYGVRPLLANLTTFGPWHCRCYAPVPDYGTITKDSLTGTWEHINLTYNRGVQDGATALTLNANGTMSGALTGSRSYDATKQLTLAMLLFAWNAK